MQRVIICAALALIHLSAVAAERQFLSGYAGTLPTDDRDKARTYFRMPAVKHLLETLESGPADRDTVEKALAGSGATIGDLERVTILRRVGDRYGIGFAYFTASDMRKIAAVADRLVPSLVAGYAAHAHDFERIFAAYPARSVSRRDLAFVVLTGMSLNWDGLALTQELGLRRPIVVTGPAFRYSFWASEALPDRSYHAMYWGSSTYPDGAWSFSSFGDAESDPRMNFPDLAFIETNEMPPAVRRAAIAAGAGPADAFGQHFQSVLGGEKAEEVARILFELRERPRRMRRQQLLALLEEIDYVARDRRGRTVLRVPVLDDGDRAMVDEALALSRAILRGWLHEHSAELRASLADLTAMRSGITFEQLFTQIWHELFGAATRELARSGVTADPYAAAVRYKGSLSMLWKRSLYRFAP